MNIDEASKKWSKSCETICKWVCRGYIDGISISENQLIFPDIPTPHIIGKNVNVTSERAYKEILKACQAEEYIDACLLRIDKERFEVYMTALKQAGYLIGENNSSNMGCTITPSGIEVTKRINLNPTLNVKIGLVNF
jgi:hypothetical protein